MEAGMTTGLAPTTRWWLRTLDGFELVGVSGPVQVQPAAARLLALLAVREGALQRTWVGGTLWMDTSDHQACANLRSLLWRFQKRHTDLVEVTPTRVWLGDAVDVDMRRSRNRARAILEHRQGPEPADIGLFAAELLPDWYDEWLIVERERDRQRRLHALETLCHTFSRLGQHALGLDAGLAAVAIEPLRESAHRAVICAHLAEGNVAEAIRQYQQFARLLAADLGLEPSVDTRRLLPAMAGR
jgi:DNA-binding SARP family transcriptional activator